MKIYLSADIEGVAGIAAAAEANMATPAEYEPFRRQMAAEVAAACDGAFAAGAREVVVKDAHGSGRNLVLADLTPPPERALRLIRGWSGHPFGMVEGLDRTFEAAVFVGFHCAAGQAGNPLAHTLNGRLFAEVTLNGEIASELRLYAMAAGLVDVPVRFVSGDRRVCAEAEAVIPGVVTVATLEGNGPSVVSLSPAEAIRAIRAGVERALASPATRPLQAETPVTLGIRFHHAAEAYARSFYPGVRQVDDLTLELTCPDYLDALTFLRFASRYQ